MKFLALKEALIYALGAVAVHVRPASTAQKKRINRSCKAQRVIKETALDPIDKNAAMVTAKAPWWAKPPLNYESVKKTPKSSTVGPVLDGFSNSHQRRPPRHPHAKAKSVRSSKKAKEISAAKPKINPKFLAAKEELEAKEVVFRLLAGELR
jgi:hypothetical protein